MNENSSVDRGALWAIAVHTAYADDCKDYMLNLSDGDLATCDLQGANFVDAILENVHFFDSYLRDANLEGAYLAGANFYCATCANANFRESVLQDANFHKTNLTDANLSGAILEGANFEDAVLSGANVTDTRILSIRAIGSQRGDNIYASPVYDNDGNQIGWGYHLGCFYSESELETRGTIVNAHGEGTYARCFDMLVEMCAMVFNPTEEN